MRGQGLNVGTQKSTSNNSTKLMLKKIETFCRDPEVQALSAQAKELINEIDPAALAQVISEPQVVSQSR